MTPQVAAMVEGLAQKLKANPDDGEGWVMLGRSYRVLGRFDAAVAAYGGSGQAPAAVGGAVRRLGRSDRAGAGPQPGRANPP